MTAALLLAAPLLNRSAESLAIVTYASSINTEWARSSGLKLSSTFPPAHGNVSKVVQIDSTNLNVSTNSFSSFVSFVLDNVYPPGPVEVVVRLRRLQAPAYARVRLGVATATTVRFYTGPNASDTPLYFDKSPWQEITSDTFTDYSFKFISSRYVNNVAIEFKSNTELAGERFSVKEGVTKYYTGAKNGYSNINQNICVINNQITIFASSRRTFTTSDGAAWSVQQESPVGQFLRYPLTAKNSQVYVRLGSGGNAAYSANLTDWKLSPANLNAFSYAGTWYYLAWTGTRFVAVNDYSVVFSTDGITWTAPADRSALYRAIYTTAVTFPYITSVVGSGNLILVCASPGVTAVSTDGGDTWTNSTQLYSLGTNNSEFYAAWTGTKFVAASWYGNVYVSSDGLTWSKTTLPDTGWFIEGAGGNGDNLIVAGGGKRAYSTDGGTTWSSVITDSRMNNVIGGYGSDPSFVYFDSKFWVYAGEVLTSSDNGATFTSTSAQPMESNFGAFDSGAYVNGRAVLTGATSIIDYSADNGATWNRATVYTSTATGVNRVAYGNGIYLAGPKTTSSTYATSPDLQTWTERASGLTAGDCRGIFWDGTKFIVICNERQTATTPDGVTWTISSQIASTAWGASNIVCAATNGSGLYMIGGLNGRVATSTDGLNWTYRGGLASSGWSTRGITAILWRDGQFILHANSYAATTTDGTSFTTYFSNTSNTSFVVDCGTHFVKQSNNGRISISLNGVSWSSSGGQTLNNYEGIAAPTNIPSFPAVGVYPCVWTGTKLIARTGGISTINLIAISPEE